MGLAGPRGRTKIPQDPNNTTWSRSSTKYGQRILEAQGWAQGDSLGAGNTSSNASYKTAVSVWRVRSLLKDGDMLGLGASRGGEKDGGAATGLHGFQDLLGRLNGKSAASMEKEQKQRYELGKARYLERWSTPRFVSAGHLVGDSVQTLRRQDESTAAQEEEEEEEGNMALVVEKKNKKNGNGHESTIPSAQDDKEANSRAKAQRRAERAERKLQRQRRRERRAARRAEKLVSAGGTKGQDPRDGLTEDTPIVERKEWDVQPTPGSIPAVQYSVGTGAGRSALRRRYIQQKKMCMMDAKALNEVRNSRHNA
ncbi:MAG: hypothetical protein Q9163_001899 [Psora crenata]